MARKEINILDRRIMRCVTLSENEVNAIKKIAKKESLILAIREMLKMLQEKKN